LPNWFRSFGINHDTLEQNLILIFMYVRLKHTHIFLCMQPCIVNFNFWLCFLFLNMRNQTYAYRLVLQIFAQVEI
jgi:hypothetical protein